MKIPAIGYTMPKINFGAKKTLYTDFDGTYFPFERSDIGRWNKAEFSAMYQPFDTFKKSDDEFSVVVATGRTKNDFMHTQEKIKNERLTYCMPDGVITSNGANTFKINHEDGKLEAIDITETDSENWDVIDKAVEFAKKCNPDITFLECNINGMEETYDDKSSEYALDRMYSSDKERYVSVARDGKNSVEIVFSKGADDDTTADMIQEYIDEKNAPYTVEHYENSPYTIVPEYNQYREKSYVCANLILIKRKSESGIPDKYDVIKKELKKSLDAKSGDMIICAGDGFNDEKMLNPLNYLDLIGYNKEGVPEERVLNDGRVIQGLKRMPFKSIITGTDPKLNGLRDLAEKLEERGVHTISVAPNPKVDLSKAVGKILDEANNKDK